MRIFEAVICEDQATELMFIQKELYLAFQNSNFPVHFDTFQNGTTLLKKLAQSEKQYDLLFFDIEMPGINGIDLCKRLRSKFPESLVIFISNKEELVFQTFEVRPFRFIRKNHFRKELPQLVAAIIHELRSREYIQISVQELHSSNMYTWNVNQILYVEALSKRCRVVTETSSNDLQYRFMDFEALLSPHGFLKPHRSFLVNYRFISVIQKDKLILDNGKEISVSRNRLLEIKTQFSQWVNGGNHVI
jgi:DNA-binding LytR/AlgR family response regulator